MPSQPGWSATASTYTSNIARTSTLAGASILRLTSRISPVTPNSKVIDIGAGTGALSLTLASQFPPTKTRVGPSILATDISEEMLSNISSKGIPNVATKRLDARAITMSVPSTELGTFTHGFNLFMLQTVTTPSSVLQEMYFTLVPSIGVISIAIWAERNGPFEIWETAARNVNPGYTLPAPFDDPNAWRTKQQLSSALEEARFVDIEVVEEEFAFPFESPERFAQFWFGAGNPAAVQCMSNWPGEVSGAEKDVKREVEKVVRNNWGGGKDIKTWGVLGVGRKK